MLWDLTACHILQSALLRDQETYKFTSSGSLAMPMAKIQRAGMVQMKDSYKFRMSCKWQWK